MTEEIDHALKALMPVFVSELKSLGCSLSSVDTDDLLQEARIRIWQALEERGDEIFFLDAYAKRVVLSVFMDEVRKIFRQRGLIEAAGRCGAPIAGIGTVREGPGDRLKQDVEEMMGSLGAARRRAIELRLEGFSFAEIACLNRWSVRKAQGLYYRGIKELRALVAERGIDHEG